MKLLGSLALGSSSARKYFSTCDVCFQKFRVSLIASVFVGCFGNATKSGERLYLVLLVTREQQHVHRLELIHVSMPLELLSYFGP